MDLLRLALKTSMIFHSDRIDSVGPRVCGFVHRFHLARGGRRPFHFRDLNGKNNQTIQAALLSANVFVTRLAQTPCQAKHAAANGPEVLKGYPQVTRLDFGVKALPKYE